MTESVKVIIVGGGAAGLAAAKTLGPSVDFCLIEAADYLGGRIRTIDAGSNLIVDLGAQYIHGHKNNLVYEMCQNLDCILPDDGSAEKGYLVVTTGQQAIDPAIMMKVLDLFEGVTTDARALSTQRTVPVDAPCSEYLFKHFKARLHESLPEHERLFPAFLNYFDQSESIENGCISLAELSLAEYGSFEYLEGLHSTTFKNGGYRPFVNFLKSQIADQRRIRLNSEVTSVRFHSDRHQLELQVRQRQGTNEGETYTIFCDHLIWTSSLGYLKANFRTIFAHEPQLIEQKQAAIENLGFDTVNKVVLIYDQRFWPEDAKHIMLLHTNDSPFFPSSSGWNAEGLNEETMKILVRAIHRYEVLASTKIPVLICWFGGEAAVLLEQFSDTLIGQICHEVLCHCLKVPAGLHQPKHIVKSEWHKNPFVRGSYTYYSIRSTSADGTHLQEPYQPDGIPRVLFAGEATHEHFFSSVHGALESGIREANRLVSYWNQK